MLGAKNGHQKGMWYDEIELCAQFVGTHSRFTILNTIGSPMCDRLMRRTPGPLPLCMAALCRRPPFTNSPPSPHSHPINLTLGIMKCGTYLLTLRNWTRTWEWHMSIRVVENRHQEGICYEEIERCAQITSTFLGSQLGGPVMEKYLVELFILYGSVV